MGKKPSETETFSKAEATKRFQAALRGAFATPPKPMKDIPRKRPITKPKRRVRTSA